MIRFSDACHIVDQIFLTWKAFLRFLICSYNLHDIIVSEWHWGRVYYGSELSVVGDQLQTVSQL